MNTHSTYKIIDFQEFGQNVNSATCQSQFSHIFDIYISSFSYSSYRKDIVSGLLKRDPVTQSDYARQQHCVQLDCYLSHFDNQHVYHWQYRIPS